MVNPTRESTAAFVRAHTRVVPASYVPEVRLHQADDVYALWQAIESAPPARAGSPDAPAPPPADEVLPPPFWAFPWPGGQALARHLLDHPDLVAGRTVLDLAAGSGLAAIAAAQAGAAEVTANEVDAYALAAIGLNAELNQVAVRLAAGDLLDGEVEVDLVLVGDAFYRRPMARRVLRFLHRAWARGAAVLVGDPGRAYLPREQLIWVAGYQVPAVADLEDGDVKQVDVWRLAGGSPAG